MEYKNVFEDFYWETTGDTGTSIAYEIQDEDGNHVFTGKVFCLDGTIKVNVAQKIRDWLENEIGDFRESDGEFFDHPDAIHAFSLIVDNEVQEEWMVIFSFEPWDGGTYFFTTAINTHASPMQKLFMSYGSKKYVPSQKTSSITDGGGGDGPGALYFTAQSAITVPYGTTSVSVPVHTNIEPSDIVVSGGSVTCTSQGQTEFVFSIPTTVTEDEVSYTVEYYYGGEKYSQTVITVEAFVWVFDLTGHTVGWEGGEETFPIFTNVDVSALTVTVPSGVTLVTKGQNNWTFEFPFNEHGFPEDWEFTVTYKGNTKTFTIHQNVRYNVYDEYFTVQPAGTSLTISTNTVNDGSNCNFYYRVDGGEWVYAFISYAEGSSTFTGVKTIRGLTSASTVEFKDLNINCGNNDGFRIQNARVAYGNILSLLYGDDFHGKTDLVELSYASMFWKDTDLVDASLIAMPTGTLCCNLYAMFKGCTSLEKAPRLQMRETVGKAYSEKYGIVISGGGSLHSMFYGCTSLVSAPPKLEIINGHYGSMFQDCTSLVTAPAIIKGISSANSCASMFRGCTSLLNAPVLDVDVLARVIYESMFLGCTSLKKAPVLKAEVLEQDCYDYMFSGCTSLEEIVCYAKSKNYQYCSYAWLADASATGDIYVTREFEWTTGTSGIPSGWTVHYLD